MRPDPGSPASWRLLEWVLDPWLRRQLSCIRQAPAPGLVPAPGAGHPLVLVANHTSWYDGFLIRRVQRRVAPRATLRTLMLSQELEGWRGGRPVLRQLGGTGFDPSRPVTLRGALRSLGEVRDTPGGLAVAFFPQGRIYPSWREPLGFRPGLRLVLGHLAPATLLPVFLHLEAGRERRPEAWICPGRPMAVEPGDLPSVAEVEVEVARAGHGLRAHLSRWGEGAREQGVPHGGAAKHPTVLPDVPEAGA